MGNLKLHHFGKINSKECLICYTDEDVVLTFLPCRHKLCTPCLIRTIGCAFVELRHISKCTYCRSELDWFDVVSL